MKDPIKGSNDQNVVHNTKWNTFPNLFQMSIKGWVLSILIHSQSYGVTQDYFPRSRWTWPWAKSQKAHGECAFPWQETIEGICGSSKLQNSHIYIYIHIHIYIYTHTYIHTYIYIYIRIYIYIHVYTHTYIYIYKYAKMRIRDILFLRQTHIGTSYLKLTSILCSVCKSQETSISAAIKGVQTNLMWGWVSWPLGCLIRGVPLFRSRFSKSSGVALT